MCLAFPGKILSLWTDGEMLMGSVDFSGVVQTVCLAYTPEATVGEYVIVHVGCAISVIQPEEAEKTLKLIEEVER